jgi:nucleoside-diphosphate-sugar epimerase
MEMCRRTMTMTVSPWVARCSGSFARVSARRGKRLSGTLLAAFHASWSDHYSVIGEIGGDLVKVGGASSQPARHGDIAASTRTSGNVISVSISPGETLLDLCQFVRLPLVDACQLAKQAGVEAMFAQAQEQMGPITNTRTSSSLRRTHEQVACGLVRILVLGGTSFVGRAIVEDAVRTGAEVTLFTRGKTWPGLFPELTRLIGDRDTGDYAALSAGSWDAVVDVSGYVPRHLGQAMDVVGGRVGRYLFISSHAVYQQAGVGPGSTEGTPRRPPVRDTEELSDETYGPLKVACEDDVVARYGSRATIVRPGKVAGPHDYQEGLTYWVRRAAGGGRVALPGRPEQPIQVVDSRDLARLVVQLLADDRAGAFHAVGPAEPITMSGLIQICAAAAGAQVEVVPVPPETAPQPFPLIRTDWTSQQRSPARARAAGMTARPLVVTARDVLAWDRERGEPPLTGGFSPGQEQAVLARHASRNLP